MNEEDQKIGSKLFDKVDKLRDDSLIFSTFFGLSPERRAEIDQKNRESGNTYVKVTQFLKDKIGGVVGATLKPVDQALDVVSDVTNVDRRGVDLGFKALLYGKPLLKKVKVKTPERFKPVNKRTVDVKAEKVGTETVPTSSNIVPAPKNFLDALRGKIDRTPVVGDLSQLVKVAQGQLIMDTTAGGNRPTDSNKEDEELYSKYQEIQNPDSYIVDKADPDYGKLKSDVLPKRQQEANRKALLEGKGDLLLNMLNDKELEQIFPKSYRSFYRKLKPDKKGRFVDLKRRLDIETIREMYPGPDNEDFRRTVFALAADPRFSSTVYQETRKGLIAEWLEGLDDIQGRVIKETNNTKLLEAHHVRSIRHVAALFDGLDFQERTILRNRLLNNMFPVGNNPDNLVLLNDDIHDEIHRQLDEKIGKTAAKFIDPNKNYTIEEREEIAAKMGTIINQLTQEAKDAMAEYMANKYTEVSPSARMAAEMDIAEVTGVLDATLEGYLEFVNRRGFMSIQRRIDEMDYFPEDEPAPDLRSERLTRGRGKKQLELERKYGKQLDLFKDGQ